MRYTAEVTDALDTILDAQARFASTQHLLGVLDDYLRNTAETSVDRGTLRRMAEARRIVEQLRANESAAAPDGNSVSSWYRMWHRARSPAGVPLDSFGEAGGGASRWRPQAEGKDF